MSRLLLLAAVLVVGCSDATPTKPTGSTAKPADKMAGDKMGGDKMAGDKMGGDKMSGDKMSGDKMGTAPTGK